MRVDVIASLFLDPFEVLSFPDAFKAGSPASCAAWRTGW
jgi:hypothetical protein